MHRGDTLRLSETAAEAPYFANEFVIHDSGRIRRDYVELMAVVDGVGDLLIYPSGGAARRILLRPGTLLLFRPRDDVRFHSDGGITTLYVSLATTDWELQAGFVGLDRGWALAAEPPRARFDPDDGLVLPGFRRALERFHDSPTALDLLHVLAASIPVLFPDHGHRRPGIGAPHWLAHAVEAMRDDVNLRGGLPRLLELSHVSPSHLSATVRRYFGSTPTALVADLRLRRAALLLAATQDSVRSIASRCGFLNVNYFSTAFRRTYQVTPREYRARSNTRGPGPHRQNSTG
jgi:AraC-like DNA-binding protein